MLLSFFRRTILRLIWREGSGYCRRSTGFWVLFASSDIRGTSISVLVQIYNVVTGLLVLLWIFFLWMYL